MIKTDPQIVTQAAQVSGHFPELVAWIGEWYTTELGRLPNIPPDSVGIHQGRCQALGELNKFIKDAPTLAARPGASPTNQAHVRSI